MGLKKIGKGPFRGPTPKNVFQTVDVGAGRAERLIPHASKFRGRKYVAVDPRYLLSKEWLNVYPKMTESDTRRVVRKLRSAGASVSGKTVLDLVNRMKSRHQKTRHLNFLMPSPFPDDYDFHRLFRAVPSLLLPNGKIFFTSEDKPFLQNLARLAREEKFSVRWLPEISGDQIKQWGGFTNLPLTKSMDLVLLVGRRFFRLELTFGLKKAFSDKAKRRNWTQQK